MKSNEFGATSDIDAAQLGRYPCERDRSRAERRNNDMAVCNNASSREQASHQGKEAVPIVSYFKLFRQDTPLVF